MSPLRKARLAAGLTQAELASRLGKSQASIAALERPGANPTLQSLHEAMHATGHRLELRAIPERSSVDETLIASNLRRTPAERLRNFESAHNSLGRMRELAGRSLG
jgi:transcriptional regulator with XRE-family HTH domain